MAKRLQNNDVIGLVSTSASEWIQEIYDGSKTHAVAVKNGITFFNGKRDESGVKWDGVQELEVIIPTLSDIVSNPVVLKGVIDAAGDIPSSASNGDLYYIGTDGITVGGQLCEAGDMAIYYDDTWHVISGENQVSLAGGTVENGNHTVTLGTSAVKVLDVEGKELNLAVAYPTHTLTMNEAESINVTNGTVTVAGKYVGLSSTTGASVDITVSKSITYGVELSSGDVTISNKVLEASNFTFTSGSFPTISKNAAVTVNGSFSASIAKDNAAGDFVTGVTAIQGITFAEGNATDKDFGFVASLSASDGTSFVTDVHTYDSEHDNAVAFTTWGQVTVSASNFATGWNEASDSGEVVSSITVGTVSLAEGSGILTGVTDGSVFVTGVSFGTLGVDSSKDWFVSGLGNGSDVVTDVTVGAVTLVSGNDTLGLTGSAITSASVSNHVLTFNTGTFMAPVSISQADSTISKGGFTKAGVQLSGTGVDMSGFTTASLSQSATSVSFKSLTKADLGLSQSSNSYAWSKSASTTYEAVMGYVKHSVTAADVTKNGAVLSNISSSATIPADTFAVSLTGGSLPTFNVAAATGTISGTVGTTLTTSSLDWLAVNPEKASIAGATTYELVESSGSQTGYIEVAAADEYDLTGGKVTISASSYVVDLSVSNPA